MLILALHHLHNRHKRKRHIQAPSLGLLQVGSAWIRDFTTSTGWIIPGSQTGGAWGVPLPLLGGLVGGFCWLVSAGWLLLVGCWLVACCWLLAWLLLVACSCLAGNRSWRQLGEGARALPVSTATVAMTQSVKKTSAGQISGATKGSNSNEVQHGLVTPNWNHHFRHEEIYDFNPFPRTGVTPQ